jgi:hypothetical protein
MSPGPWRRTSLHDGERLGQNVAIDLAQGRDLVAIHNEPMSAPLLFRCPSTGLMSRTVLPSGWPSTAKATEYRAIDCPSCKRMHLINMTTGALLTDEERQRKVQRCGTRATGISSDGPKAPSPQPHGRPLH